MSWFYDSFEFLSELVFADNKLVLLVGDIGCISYARGMLFRFCFRICADGNFLILTAISIKSDQLCTIVQNTGTFNNNNINNNNNVLLQLLSVATTDIENSKISCHARHHCSMKDKELALALVPSAFNKTEQKAATH